MVLHDDHKYSDVLSKKYFSSKSVTENQHPPGIEPHIGGPEQNHVAIQVKTLYGRIDAIQ